MGEGLSPPLSERGDIHETLYDAKYNSEKCPDWEAFFSYWDDKLADTLPLTAVLTTGEQPLAKIILVSENKLDIFFPHQERRFSIGVTPYRFSDHDNIDSLLSDRSRLPYPQARNLGRHLIKMFKEVENFD